MSAALLPQRIAVKMPQSTAKHQPAVMASHPLPSALERLSSTPATTPSPRRMSTMVPRNSPSRGERIDYGFSVMTVDCVAERVYCFASSTKALVCASIQL